MQKVWPSPPQRPRYRFLGFITGDANFSVEEASETFWHKGIGWLKNAVFGEAAIQQLYRPQGVYADPANQRLYVTDIGNKAVFVFDFINNRLRQWDHADESTRFVSPIGIASNALGEVFVSDSALGYVVKLDGQGRPLAKWGEAVLQRPTGLAYDKQTKRLYVADAALHKILVLSDEGEPVGQIGGEKDKAKGSLNAPTYLTIANRKLWVSDTLNARVQVFDLQGQWLSSFGKRGLRKGNLPRPKGIAVDSENHIYVVESYYNTLLVFTEQGVPLLPIGGTGNKAGQFNLPAGVWVDSRDRVYVADMFNSRIAVFQYLKQKERSDRTN